MVCAAMLLVGAPSARAGEGAQFAAAFNELLRMTWSRSDVVGLTRLNLPLKDPANPGTTVTRAELDGLRGSAQVLLGKFIMAPPYPTGPYNIGEAPANRVFPTLAKTNGTALMLVPKAYTVSGQDVRTDNFTGNVLPVLWEQLEDLHRVLSTMKYSLVGGGWSPEGKANLRTASGNDWTWLAATDEAAAAFYGAGITVAGGDPCFHTSGTRTFHSYGTLHDASAVARGGYFVVTGLPAFPRRVHFYGYARTYPLPDTGVPVTSSVWDDYDVKGVAENRWTEWGQSALDSATRVVSPFLGPDASKVDQISTWCDAPGAPIAQENRSTRSVRGLEVSIAAGIVEWTALYTPKQLSRVNVQDAEDDGILYVGCDCTECPPGADPGWKDIQSNPSCRFPLGISSGLTNAGLRVQAYITEWMTAGQPQQMLSLDTCALFTMDAANNWGFATVRRPNGVDLQFCLKGQRAGEALNGRTNAKMLKNGSNYELHFGGKRSVVHRFGASSNGGIVPGAMTLNQVRATTEGGQEATVTASFWSFSTDAFTFWPGMSVLRRRGAERYVRAVSSPSHPQAVPTYGANDLISRVDYYDSAYAPLATNTITTGSRIFTLTDAAGAVQDKIRIHAETTTVVLVERFGPLPTVAQREIVQIEETPDDLTHVRHTTLLNPGAADVQSNANETVLARFPWGLEVARDVRGAGADNPEITRYTYETNAAATNAYGRPVLVETPDGGWTRLTYDAAGRATEQVEPFGDAAPTDDVARCRATLRTYAADPLLAALNFPTNDITGFNDDRPRLEVERILGHEVARTYHAYLPDRTVTKRCRTPGATYDATDNLATTRQVFTNGLFSGYAASETQPDGRITRYGYAYSAALQQLTTTRESGEGTTAAITNGTRTITVLSAANRVVSEHTLDIASGLTLADMAYERDAYGRATNTVDRRHGTTNTATYGCCGVERSVDAEGLETRQDYTPLKQVFATTRAGVTSYRQYDVWGHAARTWEAGTNASLPATTSAYDAAGRLIASTNAQGVGVTYQHATTAAGGRMETVIGADGNTSTETFSRDGRPLAVSGSAATPACFAYGAGPGETWTIEYRGATTQATEWVKTVTDMLGNVTRVEYPDGYTVTFGYDDAGKQVRQSDGLITEITTSSVAGDVVRRAIDLNGNGVIDLAGPDRVVETVSRTVRVAGVDVSETESRIYATEGSAVATVAGVSRGGLSGTQSWSIAWGRTNYASVARNRTLATRTETQWRPDGTRAVAVYSNGLLLSESALATDGSTTHSRQHTYDALNRPASQVARAGNGEIRTTRTDYDAGGQVTNVTESVGALTRSTGFVYDALGRRVRTMLPDGGAVDVVYGPRGEVLQQSGTRTYPVRYAYDEQNRLIGLATYRQGLNGLADTTAWEYDPQRGWLNAKRYADGTRASYAYLGNGALRTRRWARGVETTYAYDPAGTPTNTIYSDGTPPVAIRVDRLGRPVDIRDATGTRQLTYAADGSLLSETLPQSPGLTLTRAYDPLGRPTNTAIRSVASELSHTGYAYDTAGRLRSVSDGAQIAAYTYGADGATVTNVALGTWGVVAHQFDGFGRLLETATRAGTNVLHRSAYTYNVADQRIRQDLSDQSHWEYAYDALGQLTSGKKFFADGLPVGGAQFLYAYDTIGNRTTAKNFRGQGTQTSAYTANALNQYTARTVPGEMWVTGEARTDAVVTVQSAVDAQPIPASRHGTAFWDAAPVNNTAGVAVDTNLVIAARLAQSSTSVLMRVETRSAVIPQTPETFAHDADGNLLTDGLWTYTWDAENRLIAMESASGVPPAQKRRLNFAYDHQSRRTHKTVFTWTNSLWSTATTTTFIYDGWNLIQEISETSTPRYAVTNSYCWGLDLSGALQGAGGIGGLLSVTRHPTLDTSYFLSDGNGNIVALTTPTGTITAQYEYGPFAEPLRTSAPSNPFRFSTRYTDPETGQIYYGFRYLNPSTGRWASRDPIGDWDASGTTGNNGDESILYNEGNGYRFVDNNPISDIDLLGLFLAAIDGTDSRKWLQIDPIKGRYNSHIRNFYEDYAGPGEKQYWHGPNLSGAGVGPTVDEVYKRICGVLEENPKEKINIVGHSRGGLIAILVAKKLNDKPCTCEKQNINFMGLYDAVDRYVWANAETIPDNVDFVSHARRDPRVHSRPLFSNTGTSGGREYGERIFRVTHAGAGGDPWGGDHPTIHGKPTITKEQDEQASEQVDAWMRSRFH